VYLYPIHYANGFPSGVTIVLFSDGTLGVISDLLIHDNEVTGGIIGGVSGLFTPKRV